MKPNVVIDEIFKPPTVFYTTEEDIEYHKRYMEKHPTLSIQEKIIKKVKMM